MSVFNVYAKNEEQEKALILIFDAMGVDYEKELDATAYLMSSPANQKALDESIAQLEAGRGVKIALEDLFAEDDEHYLKAIEVAKKRFVKPG